MPHVGVGLAILGCSFSAISNELAIQVIQSSRAAPRPGPELNRLQIAVASLSPGMKIGQGMDINDYQATTHVHRPPPNVLLQTSRLSANP